MKIRTKQSGGGVEGKSLSGREKNKTSVITHL